MVQPFLKRHPASIFNWASWSSLWIPLELLPLAEALLIWGHYGPGLATLPWLTRGYNWAIYTDALGLGSRTSTRKLLCGLNHVANGRSLLRKRKQKFQGCILPFISWRAWNSCFSDKNSYVKSSSSRSRSVLYSMVVSSHMWLWWMPKESTDTEHFHHCVQFF